MVLLSHPVGNANVRHAALALAESQLLAEYWTCVSWDPRSPLNRLLPRSVQAQLARRALPDGLRPFTHHTPWREAGRMLAARLGWKHPIRHERGMCSIDAVHQSLDRRVARRVARGGLRGVYAYEDGASASFAAAREHGVRCIYDLPIGYWRVAHEIYAEEAAREPEWAGTLSGMRDSAGKLERKDRELALAETVIVASSFTRRTIESAPQRPAQIHVIPYGSPAAVSAAEPPRPSGDRLRVFFAGSLGQRKGLSYLLEAIDLLGSKVELTLLGKKVVDDCRPLNAALARHRWIRSLPHAGVLEEMSRHDVFVFPSLFEGFGLVILEAMAQGLPVIATPHTAGPDLMRDGEDGFIVPIRSAGALAEKLDLLARDSKLLSAMKIAARATARRWTWAAYHTQLSAAVRSAISPAPQ